MVFKKGNAFGFKKGQIPWNKNLTAKTDKRLAEIGKSIVATRIKNNSYIQSKKTRLKKSISMTGLKRSKDSIEKGIKTRIKNNSYKHSEKTKQFLREHSKGNKSAVGCKHSEESKIGQKEWRKNQIFPLKDTRTEIKVQTMLNNLNIKFQKHKYMNIKHGYQCDIFIPSLNLVIECDGNYWHKYPKGLEIDRIRSKELIESGFKVLRLWESQINKIDLLSFDIKLRSSNNANNLL